jgi:TonB family protein
MHPIAIASRRLPAALVLALVLSGAPPARGASPADEAGLLDAPRLAQDLRLSGEVLLEALVDSTGAVRATNVLRSHPVLDDSAALVVRQRRFEPARDSTGRAIPGVRVVPVRFAARRPRDVEFEHYVQDRAQLMRFDVVPDVRPDSAGRIVARWTATGTKSHELRVVVLTPDGVGVEPSPDMLPQRLLDGDDAPGWPAWRRSGKQIKAGTGGEVTLTLPASHWWSTGRIAFVALYCDILDRTWVVRQSIFRIESDAFGPLLVRDAGPADILAGPDRVLGPRAGAAFRRFPPTPSSTPLNTGEVLR